MKKETRNLLIAIAVFIVVIVLAMLLYNKFVSSAPSVEYAPTLRDLQSSAMAPGQPEEEADDGDDTIFMPNIPLYRLDGSETDFYEVAAGKPVVINYFASWCPPCQAEMPHFVQAYNELKDDVTFIFLDALDGQRETLTTVKKFIGDYKMEEDSVYYDEGIFAYVFDTNSLPTTIFFYGDGAIAGGQLGMVSEELLHLYLGEIVSEALRKSQ